MRTPPQNKDFDRLAKKMKKLKGKMNARAMAMGMLQTAERKALPRIRNGYSITGAKFPPYSREPMYVPVKTRGFKPKTGRGKTGKTTFNNGRKHKSYYLPGGYKQMRSLSGRSITGDRLDFTGSMLGVMRVVPYGQTGAKWHFTQPKEAEIAAGNQEKYNFFGLHADERRSALLFGQRKIKEAMRNSGFKES